MKDMHVNNIIKIGRIETLNKKLGIGEISSSNEIYSFTKNSLENQDLEVGDIVKFRAEKKHQEKIAYFIRRYNENEILPDMSSLTPKKYNSEN